MAISKDEILEAIAQMSVMDVVELVKAMEDKFGVSAQAAVMAAPATAGTPAAEAEPEQSEFALTLTSIGEKKVNVIKVVRAITGLGLKEAKDLVDGAPGVVKEAMTKEDAEKAKKDLEEAGAQAELK